MGWVRKTVLLGGLLTLTLSGVGTAVFHEAAGADLNPKPQISIQPLSQNEGDSGTTIFTFAVSVTDPNSDGATGHAYYETSDGTATAPDDYTAVLPTQFDVTAGQSTTVSVTVNGDDVPERDETFTVTLINPSAGFQTDPSSYTATGTILNDDGSGDYSIADSRGPNAMIPEGDSGTTAVPFTVTRTEGSVAANVPFTVSAPDGATPGVDFTVASADHVHFDAGATTADSDIVIKVVGDTVAEPLEQVVVTLDDATPPQTSFVQASDSLYIKDDDSSVTGFKIANTEVQADEGASGTTTPMVFTVSRTDSKLLSTVDYTVTDAGMGETQAKCTSDYFLDGLSGPDPNCETTPYSGTLTFNPGDKTQTITVDAVGDDLPEGDQVFNVDLTNFVGTEQGMPPDYSAEAHGTILNDDGVGRVKLIAPTTPVSEGSPMAFTVSRTWGDGTDSTPVEQDVTIPWSTSNPARGGHGVATPGVDFTPTSGTVTLHSGDSVAPISLDTVADGLSEPDESVAIVLGTPVQHRATLDDPSSGSGTISASAGVIPTVQVAAVGGLRHVDSGSMTFSVSLSAPPGEPIDIDYSTVSTSGLNAAIANRDYRPSAGVLHFAQGQSGPMLTNPIAFLPQSPHKDEVFAMHLYSGSVGFTFDSTQAVTIAGRYSGFRVFAADGATYNYDGAKYLGGCNPHCGFVGDVIGMSPTPDTHGYWLATNEGRVYTSGTARYFGGLASQPGGGPIQSIAATPDGLGYWLLGSDGGVFSFGDAKYYGGLGGLHLYKPAVAITATPDGRGYWIVASDGGLFAFGDAGYFGSFGSITLSPGDFVTSMARTSDGKGYWMATGQGGVFAFGDARYEGNALRRFSFATGSVVSIAPTSDDLGYVLVTSDENPSNAKAFVFGNAHLSDQPGDLAAASTVSIPAASFVIGASGV